jgi:lysophospholipase L1-like esterase
MGGENSMPNWVNANPPLAFKDYIHFNDQGAKKVAQLFTDALIDEYNKYK